MRSETNLKAKLWNGTLVKMELWSENLDIRIGLRNLKYDPTWIAYDIILRKSWLTSVNPMIDCTLNRMRIKTNDRITPLEAECHKHGHPPI